VGQPARAEIDTVRALLHVQEKLTAQAGLLVQLRGDVKRSARRQRSSSACRS